MTESGLISVIIPVYNVEQYLRECVDSVLAQTYQNFEIILVDDGSTDGSGAICDVYAEKDERIRCVHKENGGASSARNVGLDTALGEFVFFLDSDDWLNKITFEKMLVPMMKSEIDFSFCEAYAVNDDTGEVRLNNYAYHRDYGEGDSKEFFVEMVKKKEFHVAVWMILYRSKFLEQNDFRFVEGIMYEDCIFAYQVYKQAKKIAHVHKYLYHRRYHKNSVMTSKKTVHNFNSAKYAYEAVVVCWKKHGALAADCQYVSRIAYNVLNIYSAMTRNEKQKCVVDFATIKKDILANDSFKDRNLKARCYGTVVWVLSKVANKILNR